MTSHTIHGPGELIAIIPALLGYYPSESVVVVALSPRGEIDLTARVDREDLLLPEIASQAGGAIAAQLRRVAAHSVIVVSFTEDDASVSCEAIDALLPQIQPLVDMVTAWTSDGRGYRAPGCADPECCPPEGTPLPSGSGGQCSCEAPLRVAPTRPASSDATAPERERRRAARAGDRWWARREIDPQEWRCESLAGLTASIEPSAGVLDLGRAAVSLRDVRVRDALIVTWLGGSASAIVDVLEGRSTAEVAAALDGALRDSHRPPPHPADVRAALEWCHRMLRLTRRRDAAAVHALAAVVHWYDGGLDEARLAAQRALTCDDGYSLAGLVADVCAAGLEPAWMRL